MRGNLQEKVSGKVTVEGKDGGKEESVRGKKDHRTEMVFFNF
jgi:hypothetical protein